MRGIVLEFNTLSAYPIFEYDIKEKKSQCYTMLASSDELLISIAKNIYSFTTPYIEGENKAPIEDGFATTYTKTYLYVDADANPVYTLCQTEPRITSFFEDVSGQSAIDGRIVTFSEKYPFISIARLKLDEQTYNHSDCRVSIESALTAIFAEYTCNAEKKGYADPNFNWIIMRSLDVYDFYIIATADSLHALTSTMSRLNNWRCGAQFCRVKLCGDPDKANRRCTILQSYIIYGFSNVLRDEGSTLFRQVFAENKTGQTQYTEEAAVPFEFRIGIHGYNRSFISKICGHFSKPLKSFAIPGRYNLVFFGEITEKRLIDLYTLPETDMYRPKMNDGSLRPVVKTRGTLMADYMNLSHDDCQARVSPAFYERTHEWRRINDNREKRLIRAIRMTQNVPLGWSASDAFIANRLVEVFRHGIRELSETFRWHEFHDLRNYFDAFFDRLVLELELYHWAQIEYANASNEKNARESEMLLRILKYKSSQLTDDVDHAIRMFYRIFQFRAVLTPEMFDIPQAGMYAAGSYEDLVQAYSEIMYYEERFACSLCRAAHEVHKTIPHKKDRRVWYLLQPHIGSGDNSVMTRSFLGRPIAEAMCTKYDAAIMDAEYADFCTVEISPYTLLKADYAIFLFAHEVGHHAGLPIADVFSKYYRRMVAQGMAEIWFDKFIDVDREPMSVIAQLIRDDKAVRTSIVKLLNEVTVKIEDFLIKSELHADPSQQIASDETNPFRLIDKQYHIFQQAIDDLFTIENNGRITPPEELIRKWEESPDKLPYEIYKGLYNILIKIGRPESFFSYGGFLELKGDCQAAFDIYTTVLSECQADWFALSICGARDENNLFKRETIEIYMKTLIRALAHNWSGKDHYSEVRLRAEVITEYIYRRSADKSKKRLDIMSEAMNAMKDELPFDRWASIKDLLLDNNGIVYKHWDRDMRILNNLLEHDEYIEHGHNNIVPGYLDLLDAIYLKAIQSIEDKNNDDSDFFNTVRKALADLPWEGTNLTDKTEIDNLGYILTFGKRLHFDALSGERRGKDFDAWINLPEGYGDKSE